MTDERFRLPPEVHEALTRLGRAGHEAFIVGGCVRDTLMGRPVSDYDMMTSATPDETAAAFADCRIIETGMKHGTVTVILSGRPLEITTYRTDGAYSDGRHPDEVSFTSSLREDLARRDFTVNAMAYHPDVGLVDRFGGLVDLDRKVIRCVGDPRRRFSEDALRILRALRFASVLSFRIDGETFAAASELRENLRFVSAERVYAELSKLLRGGYAEKILLPSQMILAEAAAPLASYDADAWAAAARRVSRVPRDGAPRYAALFWWLPEGEAARAAELLKMDGRTRNAVLDALRLRDVPLPENDAEARELLRRGGADAARTALLVRLADGDSDALDALRLVWGVLSRGEPYNLRMLAVSGRDLMEAGIPAGKSLGNTLERLLDGVIAGRLPNEKDALLRAANPASERSV